ncbi:MAG: GAF domain-containing protein [Chloroflexi bacterium]|nr:GAF domain-containing protein [Chloroflexota bacterium]
MQDKYLDEMGQLFAALARDPQPEEALERLNDAVRRMVNCSDMGLWLADDTQRMLELTVTNMARSNLTQTRLAYGQGMVGVVAEGRRSIIVSNAQWDFEDEPLAQARFSAAAGVPIVWQDELRGVLVAMDSQAGHVFTMRDIRLLEMMALYAAALITTHNLQITFAQTAHDLTEERERVLHIQTATRQMLEEPDLRANLLEVTRAIQALGWGDVVLGLYADNYTVDELITVGIPAEHEETLRAGVVPHDIWKLFLNGRLEQFRIGGFYYIPAHETGAAWEAGDVLFAPLRLGQERISGVIRVDAPVDTQRPTGTRLRPLDILASQAAYTIENARLLEEKALSAEALADQVEELSMIHRADRELSAHLNVDRVMTLTMDWALRRTGADTGLLALMTDDERGLVPLITMGHLDEEILRCSEQNPWPLDQGVMGLAATSGQTQVFSDLPPEHEYMQFMPAHAQALVSVPLAMRGKVLGVITLAARNNRAFSQHETSFLERLARRAAVALDNAHLYRQSEQLADDMAVLYSASRAITATLERDEVLQRIAQSMAMAMECSSAMILGYHSETDTFEVLIVYKVGTVRDAFEQLPDPGMTISFDQLPALRQTTEKQQSQVLRAIDLEAGNPIRQIMEERHLQAAIMTPMVAQGELLGVAVVIEGRHDRVFTTSEVFKAETLASQASVALRQSMLYSEVLELEKIKSEMIRMASHDLRNPLNNIMGYIELLAMNLESMGVNPDQAQYIENLRRGTKSMQSLIDDLLTLERAESQRQSEWQTFDLGGLVVEVIEAVNTDVELKHHTLTLQREEGVPTVFGSVTQLRQAITNLIGNAVKYTPDEGQIEVRFGYHNDRLQFSVEDNGYGISPERQARLFERFYRAQEPGTDMIPGTGLGLSLVKTVVERHGGQVWFESEPGAGSTFGFWLPPIDEPPEQL